MNDSKYDTDKIMGALGSVYLICLVLLGLGTYIAMSISSISSIVKERDTCIIDKESKQD